MANQIRLKRASGSDPGASDLVVGELAVRTDTGKLFTKKDDNSVAEISGGGISDGDKGDITVSSSGATFTIDNDVVTFAKMQNVSTSRLLGRTTSSSGDIEELTASTVRTLLNVADGATNVTNTNQLTNGAGFITATLTNEQVQDIVGGMVTGNTETGITVTYQDGDGTIDFVVGTLNQDTTGNAATATALETARTIAGVSFDGSANISLNNNAITNGAGYIDGSALNASNLSSGTIPDARFPATLPAISGANLTNLPSSSDSTKMPLSGGEFTGDITTHDVIPDGNNTRDLGSSSNRFANLFVNDMHFANSPENTNKVDGTWGDWTLQEGEDSIFMLNNRNGKKYKMNLTEIV